MNKVTPKPIITTLSAIVYGGFCSKTCFFDTTGNISTDLEKDFLIVSVCRKDRVGSMLFKAHRFIEEISSEYDGKIKVEIVKSLPKNIEEKMLELLDDRYSSLEGYERNTVSIEEPKAKLVSKQNGVVKYVPPCFTTNNTNMISWFNNKLGLVQLSFKPFVLKPGMILASSSAIQRPSQSHVFFVLITEVDSENQTYVEKGISREYFSSNDYESMLDALNSQYLEYQKLSIKK